LTSAAILRETAFLRFGNRLNIRYMLSRLTFSDPPSPLDWIGRLLDFANARIPEVLNVHDTRALRKRLRERKYDGFTPSGAFVDVSRITFTPTEPAKAQRELVAILDELIEHDGRPTLDLRQSIEDAIRRLQRRRRVRGVAEFVPLYPGPLLPRRRRSPPKVHAPREYVVFSPATLDEWVSISVMALLSPPGDPRAKPFSSRVSRCDRPDCQTLFVNRPRAGKPRRVCSDAHANSTRVARNRAAHKRRGKQR
jgi:hypothetical protein